MLCRSLLYVLVLIAAVLLTSIFEPLKYAQTWAQGNCRAFSETSKQVCGRFLEYWQHNGGLAQQDLPLSNEFQEISALNGQIYTVQYFERAVFEKHPENAPRQYVLERGPFARGRVEGDRPVADEALADPQPPLPREGRVRFGHTAELGRI
jgi:hypothetical protein